MAPCSCPHSRPRCSAPGRAAPASVATILGAAAAAAHPGLRTRPACAAEVAHVRSSEAAEVTRRARLTRSLGHRRLHTGLGHGAASAALGAPSGLAPAGVAALLRAATMSARLGPPARPAHAAEVVVVRGSQATEILVAGAVTAVLADISDDLARRGWLIFAIFTPLGSRSASMALRDGAAARAANRRSPSRPTSATHVARVRGG
mmetsp:Transcript_15489/g.32670  ORF Transcript_15489/g.32670 Transcript_15489/m.32670 type:complete len:205 (+) Transcript_15489:195-809(+)